MVYSLVSIYFDSVELGMQYKQTAANFMLLIQRNILNFDFFRKGSRKRFSTRFYV